MILLEKIIKLVLCVWAFCSGFHCILYYRDKKYKFLLDYFILMSGIICFALSITMAVLWVFK